MSTSLKSALLAVLTVVLLYGCGGGGGGSGAHSSGAQSFTVSGSVSGLYSGTHLTLVINGTDPVNISASGSFKFSEPVAANSSFVVTVSQQPINQICTVSNGVSNNLNADVQNVVVVCSATGVTIAGAIAGLPTGTLITLLNNGTDPITLYGSIIAEDLVENPFSFPTTIALGSGYNVTVGSQPIGLYCTVQNGTASNVVVPVTNIVVVCGPATESVAYSFTGAPSGYRPQGPLTLGTDGNLYGTTVDGGTYGMGDFFKLTPTGAYTELYSFGAGADGKSPNGGLVAGANGNFYGVTMNGGAGNQGTVFMITPAGVETILHSFGATLPNDGGNPESALTLGPDGSLYGTTFAGGLGGAGTVFHILADGTSYSILHTFGGAGDGLQPGSALIFSPDGYLYGTTQIGGANSTGIFFNMTTLGQETILYSFPSNFGHPGQLTLEPYGNGNMYGVAAPGTGIYSNGTIFEVTPAGVFVLLYNFAGGPSDGQWPTGTLNIRGDGILFGVTRQGGTTNGGVIFSLPPGYSDSVLYSFAGGTDASNPMYGMVQGSDGFLYGTGYSGGLNGDGAIFKY